MIKLAISPDHELEISEGTVLEDRTFTIVKEYLATQSVETVLAAMYLLRYNYEQAVALLDLATSRDLSTDESINCMVQRIALMMNHKMDVKPLLDKLKDIQDDRRVELLRGIFFLNIHQIDDAYFKFERINYKKGLEICAVMKKDRPGMAKSTDPAIKCYESSRNWSAFNETTNNKDFLFAIGKSDVFDHRDNLDVELRLIEDSISNNASRKASIYEEASMRLLEMIDRGHVSSQIHYDLGKIQHLMGNYSEALQWYEKSLNLDSGYIPARFNMCRIREISFELDYNHPEIQDFNALISLKNLIFDINLEGTSDWIRRTARTIIQARKLDVSALSSMDSLENCVDHVTLQNNKALLLSLRGDVEQGVSILEQLQHKVNFEYQDYVRYNLGVMKKDINVLKECSLPEAKKLIDYFQKNTDTTDLRLKAYLSLDSGLIDRDLLRESADPFCKILLGNILLDDFARSKVTELLEEAETLFLSVPNSVFSINGLGICAVYRNNPIIAVKLFSQILQEYDDAMWNIFNCYTMMNNYQEARKCLLRVRFDNLSESEKEMILNFVTCARDLKLIDVLIDKGFRNLEKIKAMILLDTGDLKAVTEMGIEDSEISERMRILQEKEEARKRKVAELEEYRKRRAI